MINNWVHMYHENFTTFTRWSQFVTSKLFIQIYPLNYYITAHNKIIMWVTYIDIIDLILSPFDSFMEYLYQFTL